MSWLKLHDGWNRHPKFAAMNRDARLMWVDLLTYAREQLTDGIITSDTLVVAAMDCPPKSRLIHVRTLVERGLLEELEPGKRWSIHDFTTWNDDKQTVEKARAQARERLRKFREKQALGPSGEASKLRARNADETAFHLDKRNADVTLQNPTQPSPAQQCIRDLSAKPKKTNPAPTCPGHAELIAHYKVSYTQANAREPTIGAGEGKAARDLLALCEGDLDRANGYVTRCYEPGSYWRDKATLMMLATDPDKYGRGREKGNGKVNNIQPHVGPIPAWGKEIDCHDE